MEMAKATETLTIKVTDPSTGLVYEISDVPFDRIGQVKAQFAQNGHSVAPEPKRLGAPNYDGLRKSLSENARKFLRILRENPGGINADHLAEKLGFKSGTQIGGMTGGGISKNANKFHVELTDIYTIEVSQQNGQRITTYKPGKEISRLQ